MKRFEFHPDARVEYLAAILYYDDARSGLGDEFVTEIEDAIDLILAHPLAWPRMGGRVRRCLIGRFPFGIIYTVTGGLILILAVAHLKRAPGYWKSRRK